MKHLSSFKTYEALTLNVENYDSPLFYQAVKSANGFKLFFGISKDEAVAKAKKLQIDLPRADQSFVDSLIETIKKTVKGGNLNAGNIVDMAKKLYQEKVNH